MKITKESVVAITTATACVLLMGIIASACVVESHIDAEHEAKMAELGYMQVLQDGKKLWVPAIALTREGEAK